MSASPPSQPKAATAAGAVYCGEVVHARVRPAAHRLCYRMFSLLVDVDRIGEAAAGCRLYSYNRANLLSTFDRDHGPGDGTPIGQHAHATFATAGFARDVERIVLLASPRVLGTLFNPLGVYFGLTREGALSALIYEVNNTVGERTSYVVKAGARDGGGVYGHGCAKAMYVSPFTPAEAHYRFRVTVPEDRVTVGVGVRDRDGGLLRTHFAAAREPLADRTLASLAVRFPMQSMVVAGGIHLEALRLFLKGVPVVRRHRSSRYSVAVVEPVVG